MTKERTLILDATQIEQKIVRMAHEIHERNYLEKELYIVGVAVDGNELARRLAAHLSELGRTKILLREVTLDKQRPNAATTTYSDQLSELSNKAVVLVDDVLNSGRTLIYASRILLDAQPRSLAIATLIDRFHRRFPIRADYVGLTLSTNLKEHVSVELQGPAGAVYLQ
ncbi:MAG: phosphoribosyltransferase family protein [Flavobacteriales bacterium]